MKVYFESIFVLNFLLDFMILYGTKRILKYSSVKIQRILYASFLGASSIFLLFVSINTIIFLMIKLFLSISMVLIGFGRKRFWDAFKYFYLISLLLGGVFYLFNIPNIGGISYIFLIVCSCLVLVILVKELITYREVLSNKYAVTIYFQKKCYHMDGFIDTGNRLKSPFKKEGVILVDLDIPIHHIIYVPYQTLHHTGVIPCFRPDKVFVNDKLFTHCLVGIMKNKIGINYECILPNCFKEELC